MYVIDDVSIGSYIQAVIQYQFSAIFPQNTILQCLQKLLKQYEGKIYYFAKTFFCNINIRYDRRVRSSFNVPYLCQLNEVIIFSVNIQFTFLFLNPCSTLGINPVLWVHLQTFNLTHTNSQTQINYLQVKKLFVPSGNQTRDTQRCRLSCQCNISPNHIRISCSKLYMTAQRRITNTVHTFARDCTQTH